LNSLKSVMFVMFRVVLLSRFLRPYNSDSYFVFLNLFMFFLIYHKDS